MKDYSEEIKEAASERFLLHNTDYEFNDTQKIRKRAFIDGVNSEIAAKIREDEAVEFAAWLGDEKWVKYKGVDRWKNDSTEDVFGIKVKKYRLPPQTTLELYAMFLTEKSK